MPTAAEPLLVDTSTAVAYAYEAHESHDLAHATLHPRRLGLAGHAAFEAYSVLTRLPPPARLGAAAAMRLLQTTFPETRFLSGDASASLLARLADDRITGGSVYDALVAATALEHGLPLVTLDRRAAPTYRAVGADVRLLA